MPTISRYITEAESPVARKVRAYLHSTKKFAGEATSDSGTGLAEITVATTGKHYIVVLDDDSGDSYNALIESDITPTA